MADDIDIEEHDVLENPVIKDMFPDIYALKEEIKSFEQGMQGSQELVHSYDCTEKKQEKADKETTEDSRPIINSSVTKDVIVIEDDLVTHPTEVTSQDTFSHKIILGSKPTKIFEFEEDFFEEKVKSYNVSIVLDDLKPYLHTSGRFCKDCLILFPQKLDLESHVRMFHFATEEKSDNILQKDKCYSCNECNTQFTFKSALYRHKSKQHKKIVQAQHIEEIISNVENKLLHNQENTNENVCFHCQKSFPCQQSLIDHLYVILQSKNYVCETCPKSFTSSEELTKHTVTHKKCLIVIEKIDAPEHTKNTTMKTLKPKPKGDQPKSFQKTTDGRHDDAAINTETEIFSSDKTNEFKYYKCYICNYYFIKTKFYVAHLASKHRIYEDCKGMIKEKFDDVCKFCSRTYRCMKSYNIHLHQCHKEEVNRTLDQQLNSDVFSSKVNQDAQNKTMNKSKNQLKPLNEPKAGPSLKHFKQATRNKLTFEEEPRIEPLVLKSVLFKCSKCDVHFLSSKIAKNHTEHIEMLINWKCLLCKHIFKTEDKVLHEDQHKHSENFTVYDMCPITSSPVLYNCQKCTVHFDEDNFLNHYLICESAPPNSVFCIICDILIDDSISKTHRSEHVSRNLKPTDFVIISNSDVLAKCNRKAKTKILEIKETPICTTMSNHNTLKRKSYESSSIPQKKPNKSDDILLKLNYCKTCDCYLIDSDKLEVHFKEHCHLLRKNVCRLCGLTFTKEAFKTAHENIHIIKPNMELTDFRFYDLRSGTQISPPIPKYSKCENCNIHLIPEGEHNCLQTDYLTCHICKINLTEETFKLHMKFHYYFKPNRVSSTEPDDNSRTHDISNTAKETMFARKINKNSSKRNSLDTPTADIMPKNTNVFCINNSSKIKTGEKNNKALSYSKQIHPQTVTNILRKGDDNALVTETKLTKQINLDGVVYQCRNCCVFVDSYTKVIEHCHGHFYYEEDLLETSKCQICNITLEKTCFDHHQNLHESHKEKEYFTFLIFDPFYFASENRIWTEHLFGSLSSEMRDIIINDSIYKYECRVKMELIQNGPADLTVYKCDKCRTFIDGAGLYKHAENSCFKLRKHPCSMCGLGFNSSIARLEHEKVHEEPNINLKSYRIVTFNKEEDKAFNKLLFRRSQYHVLYQCRTCFQAVDKSLTGNHKCHGQSIKSCSMCGLLIANDDYDNHVLRHNTLPNFIPKNIKIILFGETVQNSASDDDGDKLSSFTGIIYDYTFYSCTKCEICVKSNANLEKHICCLGTNRLKCSICKLYFATSRLKHHIKLHETDPDFLRNNMRLIMFNASKDDSNNCADDVEMTDAQLIEPVAVTADDSNLSKSNYQHNDDEDLEPEERPTTVIGHSEKNTEKGSEIEHISTKIYKCLCGLHFLEASHIISHFKICEQRSRASRQQCTKCDLLFTSDILFNHLILHHGNKSQTYKYNIVDLAMHNIIYRCIKCKLHFANVQDINSHLKTDCRGTTEGKDCIFCNLKFESDSFLAHDCNNVKNVNAGIEVLDLDEPLISKTNAARENKLEELKKTDKFESKCEDIKQMEINNKDVNSEDNKTLENNLDNLSDDPPEELKTSTNESQTGITHAQWETYDIELPSSTLEINASNAFNQSKPSTSNKNNDRETANMRPIQVCITTSSTQSIPNESQKTTADLVTANDSNKHRKSQRPFYKRQHNSGRTFKRDYPQHHQYQNNIRIPARPWQNYQNGWQNTRGHGPRGQMRPIRPGPPNHHQNRYPNPGNRFYGYAKHY